MSVRRDNKARAFKRELVAAMKRTQHRAAEIINRRAKEIMTQKGHIVSGTLRRKGHVQDDETRDRIISTISFPPIYALSVEMLPDGGYLHPAIEWGTNFARNYYRNEMGAELARLRFQGFRSAFR